MNYGMSHPVNDFLGPGTHGKHTREKMVGRALIPLNCIEIYS